jgi:hypothetical protein
MAILLEMPKQTKLNKFLKKYVMFQYKKKTDLIENHGHYTTFSCQLSVPVQGSMLHTFVFCGVSAQFP